ncbi:hypothetical protein BQ9231_00592 [Cedratvirus lausannensis]|uniref:Uncharacterized protein n=2 Tax=Pithoviruses TaxID=2023203 RepID=A0A285Q2M2_9VIRU|nr:hypothetical protein BQ9231_00592 [Cedratvirus lausannensis]SPN78846.1 Hypothetical protein ZAZAV_38 [Cedratvirus Zaza IHUMI]
MDLEKEQYILDTQGPDPNYLILLKDPDNKINSILGLSQEKLDLALEINEIGSIDAFIAREDDEENNILLENGFQLTLAERVLAGINATEVGDIDSQRLYMFIIHVGVSVQVMEEKENNHVEVKSNYDLTQSYRLCDYQFERWMSRIFDENFSSNHYLWVHLKPQYSSSHVSSSLEEILPGLEFYSKGRTLVLNLQQRITL